MEGGARVYEIKDEMLLFFATEGNSDICEYLSWELWCAKLVYLAEIFRYLNNVDTIIKG
jgi:hypothetical protein